MNITGAKPKRKNRTITLHLGNTLTEYETTYLTAECFTTPVLASWHVNNSAS